MEHSRDPVLVAVPVRFLPFFSETPGVGNRKGGIKKIKVRVPDL